MFKVHGMVFRPYWLKSSVKKIYIVNDDFDILLQQNAKYTSKGYYVKTFSGSKPLFDALKEAMPDLIVLSTNFQNEDGRELTKQIRNQFPDMSPIILFSGNEFKQATGKRRLADAFVRNARKLQDVKHLIASYLF